MLTWEVALREKTLIDVNEASQIIMSRYLFGFLIPFQWQVLSSWAFFVKFHQLITLSGHCMYTVKVQEEKTLKL